MPIALPIELYVQYGVIYGLRSRTNSSTNCYATTTSISPLLYLESLEHCVGIEPTMCFTTSVLQTADFPFVINSALKWWRGEICTDNTTCFRNLVVAIGFEPTSLASGNRFTVDLLHQFGYTTITLKA